MKQKRNMKKIVNLALAACLALTSPLPALAAPGGIPAQSTQGHAAETVVLDSSMDANAIKTAIENKLAMADSVAVTGSHYDIAGIELQVPAGKTLLWKADITRRNNNSNGPMLKVFGSGQFTLEEGGKIQDHKSDSQENVCEFDGSIQILIRGGSLYSGADANVCLVYSSSPMVNVHMTGGSLEADHKEKTAIYVQNNVTMDGGKILTQGERTGTTAQYGKAILSGSGNITINGGLIYGFGTDADHLLHLGPGATKEIRGGVVLAFHAYSSPLTTDYLQGSSHNLSLLPEGAKAYWDETSSGSTSIYYENGSLKGHVPSFSFNLGRIQGLTLPNSSPYDGHPHLAQGNAHIDPTDSGTVEVRYRDQTGAQVTSPTQAGTYTVYGAVSGSSLYAEEEIPLGTFTIQKRPLKLIADNQSMTAKEALPNFTYRLEGVVPGEEAAALTSPVKLTSTGDGSTPGEFDILAELPLSYGPNYTPDLQEAFVKGRLTVKAPENPSGPQPNPQNPSENSKTQEQREQDPSKGTGGASQQPSEKQPQTPQQKEGNPSAAPQNPQPSLPGKPNNQNQAPQQPKKRATPSNPQSGGGGSKRSRRKGNRGNGGGGKKGKNAAHKKASIQTKTLGQWKQDEKGWWFLREDGSWPKETWLSLEYNGKQSWYYFNAQGYMATGWQKIQNKWYYLYEKTEGNSIKGAMAFGTYIQGYRLNNQGEWVQ